MDACQICKGVKFVDWYNLGCLKLEKKTIRVDHDSLWEPFKILSQKKYLLVY